MATQQISLIAFWPMVSGAETIDELGLDSFCLGYVGCCYATERFCKSFS
jgi:hypothetical protein